MGYPTLQNWVNDLLIVVVLYNIELEQSKSLDSVKRASLSNLGAPFLLIFDNSPSAHYIPQDFYPYFEYIHQPQNPGVSFSYNTGSLRAKSFGKKWMLLLDQDTELPNNFLLKYYNAFAEFEEGVCFVPILKSKNIIISPFRFSFGGGKVLQKIEFGLHSLRQLYFANSGLLISISAFEQAGGYDEKFPLDFSDMVFCERLKMVTDSFKIISLECSHALSSNTCSYIQEFNRFKIYSHCGRLFRKKYRKDYLIQLRILMRAIKLSWKYKTLSFLFVGSP